jgi:hypothetical protein
MPVVKELREVSSFGIVPCAVEILRRDSVTLGNVPDLPGAPDDVGHEDRLSQMITIASPNRVDSSS